MLRRIGHAYEVYPLVALSVVLVIGMVLTAYYSFTKIEVWIDKRAFLFVVVFHLANSAADESGSASQLLCTL